MIEPVFLELDEIIEIHNDQIQQYGWRAGIRDLEILKSAIAMPSTGFGKKYLHSDILEIAAAYLFYIVRDHPFIDGNKRVGAVASVVFLTMNGMNLLTDEYTFEKVVRSVAEGKMDKEAIVKFFRSNTQKV